MQKLLLVLFGLALLGCAELVTRLAAPVLTGAPAGASVDGTPPPFVRSTEDPGQWTLHPAWRNAFPAQEFPRERADGSILVFCVGGSAVYGYPFAADFAFSSHLERLLRTRHPGREIHVVNAGGMSYGSHRLRRVVRQLLAYEPQAIVIYSGNNEYVEWDLGEGAEDTAPSLARWARRLVLVRSLEGLVHSVGTEPETAAGSIFGIDVRRREARVIARRDRLLTVTRYRRNLHHMVEQIQRHGAAPVLSTVACNLADWRPENASMSPDLGAAQVLELALQWTRARQAEAADRPEAAATHFAAALALDPEQAALNYEAARLAQARHELDRATMLFSEARNHDPTPIRVLPELNRALHAVAEETGVLLADVEGAAAAASADGIPGAELFLDYCHFNNRGNEVAARTILPRLEAALGLRPADTALPPLPQPQPPERLAADNGFALWWLGNVELRQGRPQRAEAMLRRSAELKPGASQPLVGLAQVLQVTARGTEALDLLRTASVKAPAGELDYFNIVRLVALGAQLDAEWRHEEALAALKEAYALDPESGEVLLQLGNYHLRRKQLEEAFDSLGRAAELHPNLAGVHRSLGLAQILAGDDEAAAVAFLEELRRHPFDARAAYRLAETATILDAIPVARTALELTLLLDPDSERARELAEHLAEIAENR